MEGKSSRMKEGRKGKSSVMGGVREREGRKVGCCVRSPWVRVNKVTMGEGGGRREREEGEERGRGVTAEIKCFKTGVFPQQF